MNVLQQLKARTATDKDVEDEQKKSLLTKEPPPVVTSPESNVGKYQANRIQVLVLADGKSVFPVDGYYAPSCQEEQEMLEYFESKGLVDLIKE